MTNLEQVKECNREKWRYIRKRKLYPEIPTFKITRVVRNCCEQFLLESRDEKLKFYVEATGNPWAEKAEAMEEYRYKFLIAAGLK